MLWSDASTCDCPFNCNITDYEYAISSQSFDVSSPPSPGQHQFPMFKSDKTFQECERDVIVDTRTAPRLHPLLYFLAHPEEHAAKDWCTTETNNYAKVFVYFATPTFPKIE